MCVGRCLFPAADASAPFRLQRRRPAAPPRGELPGPGMRGWAGPLGGATPLSGAAAGSGGRAGGEGRVGLPSPPSSAFLSPCPRWQRAKLFPLHTATAGAAATAEPLSASRSPAATLKKFLPANGAAAEARPRPPPLFFFLFL